jgi:hypothetical protein
MERKCEVKSELSSLGIKLMTQNNDMGKAGKV